MEKQGDPSGRFDLIDQSVGLVGNLFNFLTRSRKEHRT